MSSYKCPKCNPAHLMYQPTIEQIHEDMFCEPQREEEGFDPQDEDIPFDDAESE